MSNTKQVNNSCVSAFHGLAHPGGTCGGEPQHKHDGSDDSRGDWNAGDRTGDRNNERCGECSSAVAKQDNQNAAVLSSAEALVRLLNRTMYPIVQENGQRRYGPPPDWSGMAPRRGCEVFIGKIPRDCFEDELVPVFERVGPIFMFRLMMDFTGTNRGYGFCVYMNRDDSRRAVLELNNYEIRRDKPLGVCLSVDNCRLFVGGIPKTKTKEEIFAELDRVTDGLKDVIAYPSVADKTKNRGFAFVEYDSHKAAAMARRKLIPGRIQLWGQQIAVDWAEPEREVHEDIMLTVRILYVRNLMLATTEDTIRDIFVAASGGPPDCVERVKKIKDYAFVHFRERALADCAMKALNNTQIDSSWVEVNWAKPADKTDPSKLKSVSSNGDIPSGPEMFPQNQIFIDSNSGISYISTPISSIHSQSITSSGSSPTRVRSGRRNAAGSRSVTLSRERKANESTEESQHSEIWMNSQHLNKYEWVVNGVKYQYIPTQLMYPSLNFVSTVAPVSVANTNHEELKPSLDYSGSQGSHHVLNEESMVNSGQISSQPSSVLTTNMINSNMNPQNMDPNYQSVYVVNPIQQFQGYPNSAFQLAQNQPMTYTIPTYYPQLSHSFPIMTHQAPQLSASSSGTTILNQPLPAYGPSGMSVIPMAINQISDYPMNTLVNPSYGLETSSYIYTNQISNGSNSNASGGSIPTIMPITMANSTNHMGGGSQTLLNSSLLQSCGASIS